MNIEEDACRLCCELCRVRVVMQCLVSKVSSCVAIPVHCTTSNNAIQLEFLRMEVNKRVRAQFRTHYFFGFLTRAAVIGIGTISTNSNTLSVCVTVNFPRPLFTVASIRPNLINSAMGLQISGRLQISLAEKKKRWCARVCSALHVTIFGHWRWWSNVIRRVSIHIYRSSRTAIVAACN